MQPSSYPALSGTRGETASSWSTIRASFCDTRPSTELNADDGTPLFHQDATADTWVLAGQGAVSPKSVNFPGFFIRIATSTSGSKERDE